MAEKHFQRGVPSYKLQVQGCISILLDSHTVPRAGGCRVVEVPILKVCHGGISHISRILVGAAAVVVGVAVVVTGVWSPHLGLSSLPQCIALGNRRAERNRSSGHRHRLPTSSFRLNCQREFFGSEPFSTSAE